MDEDFFDIIVQHVVEDVVIILKIVMRTTIIIGLMQISKPELLYVLRCLENVGNVLILIIYLIGILISKLL